jgi:hypothetical protein
MAGGRFHGWNFDQSNVSLVRYGMFCGVAEIFQSHSEGLFFGPSSFRHPGFFPTIRLPRIQLI